MRKACRVDVPAGSHVYADTASNDDAMEDVVREASHMHRYPIRKQGSTRPLPPSLAYGQHDYRKRLETVGRLSERMRPTTIHAVTAAGCELQVFLCGLAYSLNGL